MTLSLKDLKALEAKATKGPWTAAVLGNLDGSVPTVEQTKRYVAGCIDVGAPDARYHFVEAIKPDGPADVCHGGNGPTSMENAALIAALRNAAPELIARLEEAHRLLARTRDARSMNAVYDVQQDADAWLKAGGGE